MSDPKDKDPADPTPGAPPSDIPSDAPGGKSSGRVTFDERGNSVWEWQLETGVYSRDVNTQKLKKLDLDELSIADSAIHKRPTGLGGPAKSPGGGFNPYDSSNPGNPYDSRALGNQVRPDPSASAPRRTPADMRKLDEWIKQKKQAEKKEDE
jgi:hypothetical protein